MLGQARFCYDSGSAPFPGKTPALSTHICRYPTTVATLSRRARDVVEAAFERSVDAGAASPLLPSRLHDFGFRGCCTVEQSVIGGSAHLLNFEGTDTLSAAYYVQVQSQASFDEGRNAQLVQMAALALECCACLKYSLPPCMALRSLACREACCHVRPSLNPLHEVKSSCCSIFCVVQFELNGGEPVGTSIPATEHSVMTAWHTEKAAIENMIDHFGDGLFACVMDSYDYTKVCPSWFHPTFPSVVIPS